MVGPTLFPPRKTNNISFLSCWIVYLFKYLTINLSKNYVLGYMFLVYGLQAAAAEERPPIFEWREVKVLMKISAWVSEQENGRWG